jgi:TPP-dependent pyruvate/acetoin dehydrogenase alpha subunit
MSVETLADLYRRMAVIRAAETRLGRLFEAGEIPGFIHSSVGQEAVAVGVCASLAHDDTIASTHRGHGHALAKGMAVEGLIGEILGRATGPCGGAGGSLHVADFAVGMLGANGIVGGGLPIALGSALAHRTLGSSRIACVFFGDGALAEGVLHECLNLARLWRLPLLFVCENNGWSEFSPAAEQFAGNLAGLSAAFEIEHQLIDGNDVEAVASAAATAVGACRSGAGPAILEAVTRRVRGHYEGDPQKYRNAGNDRLARDPLEITQARLTALGMSTPRQEALLRDAEAEVDRAVAIALAAPAPDPAVLATQLYAGAA